MTSKIFESYRAYDSAARFDCCWRRRGVRLSGLLADHRRPSRKPFSCRVLRLTWSRLGRLPIGVRRRRLRVLGQILLLQRFAGVGLGFLFLPRRLLDGFRHCKAEGCSPDEASEEEDQRSFHAYPHVFR
jgi:hypothetical protein